MIVIFFLGIAVGLFINNPNIFKDKKERYFYSKRLSIQGGALIRPLLLYETPPGNDLRLEALKGRIQSYVDRCIDEGDALNVSVYIRDLNNGTWIGVNEEENFVIASLIKIPLMIAYFKKAEENPAILNKEIKCETKVDILPQNIIPQNRAQLGNIYTVNELLRFMIMYSDNIATQVLFENIDEQLIAHICSDLQLPTLDVIGQECQISSRDYATFFRILYNATYLNREFSEKALELLAKTKFYDGIVTGVPLGTVVSHKFAERTDGASGKGVQLHDCGIVYLSEKPYLICIMTKGRDLNILKDIIKYMSKISYEHMARR